jgi:hypothetical protein
MYSASRLNDILNAVKDRTFGAYDHGDTEKEDSNKRRPSGLRIIVDHETGKMEVNLN